jgi:hypothetical protein
MSRKMLNTLFGAKAGGAVHMQDGGKLPPGIKRATERAKESKSVLPVAGARQARQAIQGYLGMDPSFRRSSQPTAVARLQACSVICLQA